jgi:DNA polymerase-3 subunit alpha
VEWTEREFLANEKEALGLYLTGHPFDAVRRDATSLVDGKLAEISSEPPPQTSSGQRNYAQQRREVTVAGLIMDIRKRGNRVTVVLDDDSGRLEVSLFSDRNFVIFSARTRLSSSPALCGMTILSVAGRSTRKTSYTSIVSSRCARAA